MNILYGKTEKITQEFTFKINDGGELNLKVSNESERQVVITFENGKYVKVEYSMSGDFINNRSYWHVMGAIAKVITEIEASFSAPRCA